MITAIEYQILSDLLRAHIGLALGPGKEYLLESRLAPLAASLGFVSLNALVAELRRAPHTEMVRTVCEAMSTHETSFFRDGLPFTLLQSHVLPELIATRRATRRLRIWCAAASTGQEPYSVAMTLAAPDLQLDGWNIEVLATDYSRPALERAKAGVYSDFELQRGISALQRSTFFTPVGGNWRIRDAIRRRVSFRELNLLEPFHALGTFDIILCRNVLIYFDLSDRRDVLDRLARLLAPDSFLFLGAAETAIGLTDRLTRVADLPTSVYRRSEANTLSLAV